MRCIDCDYYTKGHMYNACAITGSEYFYAQDACTLVNGDGTVNYDDEYFQNNNDTKHLQMNLDNMPFDE